MENILKSAFLSSRVHPVTLWDRQGTVTATGTQNNPREAISPGKGPPSQRKRKRTLYSKWQQLELESVFEVVPYPDISTREHLAKIIRLPEAKVQVWFQNRRARKNKSSKSDKPLYRRASSFHPSLFLDAVSPSQNYDQRDHLNYQVFPPNQLMPHDQPIAAMQQAGHLPSTSQQYSEQEYYQCGLGHQDAHWHNFTPTSTSPDYGCQIPWYDIQKNDFEKFTVTPSPGPYWKLYSSTVSEKRSQTSLGNISDVIYNAAILTNLGDV